MSTQKIDALNERITNQVIGAIQGGLNTGTWSPPWAAGPNIWSPINPITGKRYTAGNRLNLALTSWVSGIGPEYATYEQWASLSRHTPACLEERQFTQTKLRRPKQDRCHELGCELVNVRKGEHGFSAIRPITRTDKTTGEIEVRSFAAYTVFNATQIDGYEETVPVVTGQPDRDTLIEEAGTYVNRIGAEVKFTNTEGASYSPVKDCITMPNPERWESGVSFWATLVHELIHWSGHATRLNREGVIPGAPRELYANEELIAELGAAFHLAHLGMSPEPREDHMVYLAAWLEILRADPKALWKAAGKAEQASKMLGKLFGIAEVPDAVGSPTA